MSTSRNNRRRGSAYAMVLAVATALSIMGVGALALVRVERRASVADSQILAARGGAMSGFELALEAMRRSPGGTGWRQNATPLLTTTAVGNAQVTISFEDPDDGDLADYNGDPVEIVAQARSGNSRQIFRARVQPTLSNDLALNMALLAGGSISFNGTTVRTASPVASLNSITAAGASVYAPCVAPSVSGSTFYSTRTASAPSAALPASDCFNYYIARGTAISIASISGGKISGALLSPASNPFGATTNAEGIYVIDCKNQAIDIQSLRVSGTLVLLDAGPGSILHGSCSLEPLNTMLPALLVRGEIEFDLSTADLSEASVNVNFNPVGSPYLGRTDSAKDDAYASMITGLVYVSGKSRIRGLTAEGVVIIGGAVDSDGYLTIRQGIGSPIPGFSTPSEWTLIAGGIRRETD